MIKELNFSENVPLLLVTRTPDPAENRLGADRDLFYGLAQISLLRLQSRVPNAGPAQVSASFGIASSKYGYSCAAAELRPLPRG